MDIRQLRYFILVAENLNFTEAARQLFVAQSAVSQQIADLENMIGVKLFIRNKRSVQLTTAGAIFLKEAIHIVDKIKESIEVAHQAELGMIGTLRIGFLGPSVKSFLPSLIKRFRRNYPQIELHLNHLNHGALNEGLENGQLDIGFTGSFGLQSVRGLEWYQVHTEESCIVLPYDHPLATEISIDLKNLAQEPFVTISRLESPQGFDRTLQLCSNSGFSPNILCQAAYLETVLLLVEAGLGVAILPKIMEAIASSHLRFIDIKGVDTTFDLVAAWKKTNENPTVPLFIKELESQITNKEDSSLVANCNE